MSRIQQALQKLNTLSAQIDASNPRPSRNLDDLKRHVLYRVTERFDYRRLPAPPPTDLINELKNVIGQLCDAENPLLNRLDRDRMIAEISDEVIGPGPLGPLIRDPQVTEILLHGPMTVMVRRQGGELRPAGALFHDEMHLRNTLERLVTLYAGSGSGSRWEAKLPDNVTLMSIVPPTGLGVLPTVLMQRIT
jgi:pilus assembly protein CpaF